MTGSQSIGKLALSEAKRNWPFVCGFGVTLAVIWKVSAGLSRKCLYDNYFKPFSLLLLLVLFHNTGTDTDVAFVQSDT